MDQKVLLEKLTGFQLVKESPHLVAAEGSLPHSKEHATGSYHEPDKSSQ